MESVDTSIIEPIELRMIKPSQLSVRQTLSSKSPELTSLKSSISEHGLLQPIVIRPLNHGFELVAGHRRFAACKSLRWRFISCKIRDMTDKQAYEINKTLNLSRPLTTNELSDTENNLLTLSSKSKKSHSAKLLIMSVSPEFLSLFIIFSSTSTILI